MRVTICCLALGVATVAAVRLDSSEKNSENQPLGEAVAGVAGGIIGELAADAYKHGSEGSHSSGPHEQMRAAWAAHREEWIAELAAAKYIIPHPRDIPAKCVGRDDAVNMEAKRADDLFLYPPGTNPEDRVVEWSSGGSFRLFIPVGKRTTYISMMHPIEDAQLHELASAVPPFYREECCRGQARFVAVPFRDSEGRRAMQMKCVGSAEGDACRIRDLYDMVFSKSDCAPGLKCRPSERQGESGEFGTCRSTAAGESDADN